MFGEWLSLVEHLVRDQGVGGSNPLSPTIQNKEDSEASSSNRITADGAFEGGRIPASCSHVPRRRTDRESADHRVGFFMLRIAKATPSPGRLAELRRLPLPPRLTSNRLADKAERWQSADAGYSNPTRRGLAGLEVKDQRACLLQAAPLSTFPVQCPANPAGKSGMIILALHNILRASVEESKYFVVKVQAVAVYLNSPR